MDDFWKGKNVLITGVTGFIGSHLARRLRKEGARVVGIVRDIDRVAPALMDRCLMGDICDYDFVRRAISDNEIEFVFHLAASAIVRISARDPMTTYQVNVMGTVNVLEACRSVGKCTSIVVASSDKAYGDHEELPYKETHALVPKNTYDTSKACMDMVARSYAHNYDMPVVVTRCSNVYGPGDMNLSRIIPNTINRILSGVPPLLYSDIEKMEREFIYVDDVTNAYLALARVANSDAGQAYNIGGTGPVRIRDLTKLICDKMNRHDLEPEIVQRDNAFREIQRQYIDAGFLCNSTGWNPEVSLDDGISRTVCWYTDFFRNRQ